MNTAINFFNNTIIPLKLGGLSPVSPDQILSPNLINWFRGGQTQPNPDLYTRQSHCDLTTVAAWKDVQGTIADYLQNFDGTASHGITQINGQNVLNVQGSGINDEVGQPVCGNQCLWNGAYPSFSFGVSFSGFGTTFAQYFNNLSSMTLQLTNLASASLRMVLLDTTGNLIIADSAIATNGNKLVFVNYNSATKILSLYYNGNTYTATNALYTNPNLQAGGGFPSLGLGGTVSNTKALCTPMTRTKSLTGTFNELFTYDGVLSTSQINGLGLYLSQKFNYTWTNI